MLQKITVYSTNFSMARQKLAPGTEYAARVRSSPDQANYGGEWSAWSSEIHWRTQRTEDGKSARVGNRR